uniref:Uncharacterized protein n=1 Tax=Parascaris univalens TaxID=6257 RepID=A0A915CID3_PARUN
MSPATIASQLGIEVTHKEPLIVDGFGGTHITHCTSARVKLKMKRTDGRFFTMLRTRTRLVSEIAIAKLTEKNVTAHPFNADGHPTDGDLDWIATATTVDRFVDNRLAEYAEALQVPLCDSGNNPRDLATRGLTIAELGNASMVGRTSFLQQESRKLEMQRYQKKQFILSPPKSSALTRHRLARHKSPECWSVTELADNHEGKQKRSTSKCPTPRAKEASEYVDPSKCRKKKGSAPTTKSKEYCETPAGQNLQAEETEEKEETKPSLKPPGQEFANSIIVCFGSLELSAERIQLPQREYSSDGWISPAENIGDLLKVFPCKELEVSQVFANHEVQGKCYRDLPVRYKDKILFVHPRSREIKAVSEELSCREIKTKQDREITEEWALITEEKGPVFDARYLRRFCSSIITA